MPIKRRVAVMLELNWPLKRHIGVFEGTQRFAAENPHWHCVVDEFAGDTLPARPQGKPPYDGVIARASTKLARRAKAWGIPVVNVWGNTPTQGLPTVLPDFEAAARECAEHLLSRGFRRFATIARKDIVDQRQAETIAVVVGTAGFPCDQLQLKLLEFHTFQHWQQMQRAVETWMDGWTTPIGVYAGADDIGRAIAEHCKSRGWRIPLDVALVAGENDVILCEHPPPKLTSVEVGYERVGYEAARWLEELMSDRSAALPHERRLIPPVGMVIRESTDFYAVEDPLVAEALRYIGEHCGKPISVSDVAAAVHVSRATLERRFRQHLRRTIGEEIRRLRFERAKRILAVSKEPLKLIALEAGFENTATLNATFRRELNMSPGEYRQGLESRQRRR